MIYLFTYNNNYYLLNLIFLRGKAFIIFCGLTICLVCLYILKHSIKIIITKNRHTKEYHFCDDCFKCSLLFIVNMNLYIRAGYRFRCPDSIRFRFSIFIFLLHSVNIVLIQKLLIFKKNYSKHKFKFGELIKLKLRTTCLYFKPILFLYRVLS